MGFGDIFDNIDVLLFFVVLILSIILIIFLLFPNVALTVLKNQVSNDIIEQCQYSIPLEAIENNVMAVKTLNTNSETYYYVYQKDTDSKYKLQRYDSKDAKLVETNTEPPRVQIKANYIWDDPNVPMIAVNGKIIDMIEFNKKYRLVEKSSQEYESITSEIEEQPQDDLYISKQIKATIYVPKGTVKTQIGIDNNMNMYPSYR